MMNTSKDNNDKNEFNIGRAYGLFLYYKAFIPLIIIGGIAGYLMTHTWKGVCIGVLAGILLRVIYVKVFVALFQKLIDSGK